MKNFLLAGWLVTNYINKNSKNEIINTRLVCITESGLEGEFYVELIPFLEVKIIDFVSMYDVAKEIKILEMIKESSEKGKFLEF